MWLLNSCLVLTQLILTMKPVWWPVLYHWPVLHGLCMHRFLFDPPLNQDTSEFMQVLTYLDFIIPNGTTSFINQWSVEAILPSWGTVAVIPDLFMYSWNQRNCQSHSGPYQETDKTWKLKLYNLRWHTERCTVYALTFANYQFLRFSHIYFHGLWCNCTSVACLSQMAIDPWKPRKFNPVKVKAYTVHMYSDV